MTDEREPDDHDHGEDDPDVIEEPVTEDRPE
jgi:hypothetical protein